MKANQAAHSIATMCRVLGVSASGYYAWQRRGASARARTDAELLEQIRAFHRRSRGTYGAPRIHRDLRAAGVRVGRKRVARLLKQAGPARRQSPQVAGDDRAGRARPAGARSGAAGVHGDRPRISSGSPTSPTSRRGAGTLYLAVVLDVWSRRIIGWAMATHLRTSLVRRRPRHGDRAAAARRR